MTPAPWQTRILAVADRTAYIPRPASDFRPGRKAISQNGCCLVHAVVTLIYGTLELTLGYDTTIRRTLLTATGSNIAFKIAAKSLQIET